VKLQEDLDCGVGRERSFKRFKTSLIERESVDEADNLSKLWLYNRDLSKIGENMA
jgi:hypothetical protein